MALVLPYVYLLYLIKFWPHLTDRVDRRPVRSRIEKCTRLTDDPLIICTIESPLVHQDMSLKSNTAAHWTSKFRSNEAKGSKKEN